MYSMGRGGGVAVGRDAVSGWRVRGVRDCAKGKGGVGGIPVLRRDLHMLDRLSLTVVELWGEGLLIRC